MLKKIPLYIDKRSCDNCGDAIVCFAADKPCDEVCSDWQLGFSIFQDLVDNITPEQKEYLRLHPSADFEVIEREVL